MTASRKDSRLLYRMAAALLLAGFALAEAGLVAWCASLVTLWELGAVGFTYVLIAIGLIFTVWQMREIGNRRIQHL
jgi:hypothetical protein